MPQVINTNIASLNAQRNLNKSQGMLQTSLQRLSSGMRINSAKDDAAGLAISERFTAQIRGLNQAVRNANDGISLAQTAEGALGEVTNNLQRVRELAVQSANATNSSSDRAAMQQEVSELIAEIDRVATQTNFNGVQLLDGSFTSQVFQVGANVGETITVDSIADATKAGLGLDVGTATATSGAVTGALTGGELTINGEDVGVVAGDALALANAIDATGSTVSASAENIQTIAFTDIVGTEAVAAVASDTDTIGTLSASLGVEAADTYTFSFDGNDIVTTVAAATGSTLDNSDLGAFTTLAGGGSGTYTLNIDGGTNIINYDGSSDSDLTASDAFTAISDWVASSPAGDGYEISGSTMGDIVLTKSDGSVMTINEGGDMVSSAGLSAASSLISADGVQVAAMTVADVDNAITAWKSATDGGGGGGGSTADNYTITGSLANDDLQIVEADGSGFTVSGALSLNGGTTSDGNASLTSSVVAAGSVAVAEVDPTYVLTVDGAGVDFTSALTGDATIDGIEFAAALDAISGITASFNAGDLTVEKEDGSNFALSESGAEAGTQGVPSAGDTYIGTVTVNSVGEDLVIGGTNVAASGLSTGTTATTGNSLSVDTVAGANALISAVDTALNTVNGSRATLGAIQNRFESVVTSLQTSSESLSAARSRIQDTDFAAETANLTKSQILQQAGMAMMAQANSLPQNVLSLLQ